TSGWWEGLIGPGRALDTDRWVGVAPNAPVRCHGSPRARSRRTAAPERAYDQAVTGVKELSWRKTSVPSVGSTRSW
ncbi:hypothetical protein OK074_0309, partial [Actinobacteria bacterium OK074]